MNNIIIGNGVNIQYGGREALNEEIIKRAFKYVNSGKYPDRIVDPQTVELIKNFSKTISDPNNPIFTRVALDETDSKEIQRIKSAYKNHKSIYKVGIEDYMYLCELFCEKYEVSKIDMISVKAKIRNLFLDSIYCNGDINTYYKRYDQLFIDFLQTHDMILTTNYDTNLELATKRTVYYLHGRFDVLEDVYDHRTAKHSAFKQVGEDVEVVEGFEYLFSTALLEGRSQNKYKLSKQNIDAYKVYKRLIEDPQIDEMEIIKDVKDNFEEDEVRKFLIYIKEVRKNPESNILNDYPISMLRALNGEVTYLGLSPYNDEHLFNGVKESTNVTKVVYYYYDNYEADKVKQLFSSKNLELKNVREFWIDMKD